MTYKNVNLRELCEFEYCCEEVRAVLGMSEMEAQEAGMGAWMHKEISTKLTDCQVVNIKRCFLKEIRIDSNTRLRNMMRMPGSFADSQSDLAARTRRTTGNVPSVPGFSKVRDLLSGLRRPLRRAQPP
jgi:hypothetical protein